jgi:hypothetical protein
MVSLLIMPPVGHHDGAADAEALAELLDHRDERACVGGVARQNVPSDGPAVLIDSEADDDLWAVGHLVAGVAATS